MSQLTASIDHLAVNRRPYTFMTASAAAWAPITWP